MATVADPGFSRGGGVNTPNFPENCMKSKEFGRPGGACVPHAPPRSANGLLFVFGRKPKSYSTEELYIDLHGSPNKLNRLAVGHIKLIQK